MVLGVSTENTKNTEKFLERFLFVSFVFSVDKIVSRGSTLLSLSHQAAARATSTALLPPKAKEFDITVFSPSMARPLPGT